MFDVMSGYTTTGLYLMQDLDHVSNGLNMWRHILTYAGGQGIVVIALTFLFKGTAGAYKLYVGEGKDERLLPNVVHTARAIWRRGLTWLVPRGGDSRPVDHARPSWASESCAVFSIACGCSWGPGRRADSRPSRTTRCTTTR